MSPSEPNNSHQGTVGEIREFDHRGCHTSHVTGNVLSRLWQKGNTIKFYLDCSSITIITYLHFVSPVLPCGSQSADSFMAQIFGAQKMHWGWPISLTLLFRANTTCLSQPQQWLDERCFFYSFLFTTNLRRDRSNRPQVVFTDFSDVVLTTNPPTKSNLPRNCVFEFFRPFFSWGDSLFNVFLADNYRKTIGKLSDVLGLMAMRVWIAEDVS